MEEETIQAEAGAQTKIQLLLRVWCLSVKFQTLSGGDEVKKWDFQHCTYL